MPPTRLPTPAFWRAGCSGGGQTNRRSTRRAPPSADAAVAALPPGLPPGLRAGAERALCASSLCCCAGRAGRALGGCLGGSRHCWRAVQRACKIADAQQGVLSTTIEQKGPEHDLLPLFACPRQTFFPPHAGGGRRPAPAFRLIDGCLLIHDQSRHCKLLWFDVMFSCAPRCPAAPAAQIRGSGRCQRRFGENRERLQAGSARSDTLLARPGLPTPLLQRHPRSGDSGSRRRSRTTVQALPRCAPPPPPLPPLEASAAAPMRAVVQVLEVVRPLPAG